MEPSAREGFWQVLNGFIYFQAMATGCDLGLFKKLAERPGQTQAELLTSLDVPRDGARKLLLALCECRLLRRDAEGRYFNSPAAATYLDPGAPADALAQVEFSRQLLYPAFAMLTESVRAGTNRGLSILPGDEPMLYARLAHSPKLQALFYRTMGRVTERSVPMLAGNAKLLGARHVLDVGGGNGINAIALARALPQLRITLLDLPGAIGVPRKNIAEAGLSDRIAVQGLDFFNEPLPRGADVILLSHVLEIFDEQKSISILRAAHTALDVGGSVVALCITARDDETGGPSGARLSLYFLNVASGQAWPTRPWTTSAGSRRSASPTSPIFATSTKSTAS